MKETKMSAVTLRGILTTIMVLLVASSVIGFYFTQDWLRSLAISVSHTVTDSTATGNDIQSLNKLQEELLARQDIVSKVNAIATSSQTYQTQAVQDLTAYATVAGITISNYAFPASGTPNAATPSTPTNGPTSLVTITLTSPVSYTSLLKFMSAVESNLPKMQISSINLGRIAGDASSVKIDQLTIAVYTR